MTSSSTIRTTGQELSPASLAIAFAAGFLAVLTFYEAVFLLLYVGGVIPVPPFSMKPMPPLGVPEVLSQSFWGGVWGIVFLLIVPRFPTRTSQSARLRVRAGRRPDSLRGRYEDARAPLQRLAGVPSPPSICWPICAMAC
jgi:hypothetical protein